MILHRKFAKCIELEALKTGALKLNLFSTDFAFWKFGNIWAWSFKNWSLETCMHMKFEADTWVWGINADFVLRKTAGMQFDLLRKRVTGFVNREYHYTCMQIGLNLVFRLCLSIWLNWGVDAGMGKFVQVTKFANWKGYRFW